MDTPMKDIEIFYKSNIRYEITINPNDKHQFYGKPRRLQLFVMDIQKLLIKAFDNYDIEYKLCIELSEPRSLNKENSKKCKSGARLHMHGYLLMPNDLAVGNYLMKSTYYLTRWSDVQVNEYRKCYWAEYCHKSDNVMKALANHYKIKVVLTQKMPLIIR